jgi:3-hydroxypropanoate dehydrogenase
MPAHDAAALDTLFLTARTYPAFLPTPVDDALLTRIYELARMAPTAANCQPLRVVFVKSEPAREKLKPCLAPGNVAKTMAAPVTAILAADSGFAEHMPRLFPSWPNFQGAWDGMPPAAREWMLAQNGSLQAGYFILAARSLGLDCGPMGGFDREKTDAAFFADGRYKSQLLVRLGYGDPASLYPRGERLSADEACRIE